MMLVLCGTVPANHREGSGRRKAGAAGPLDSPLPSEPSAGVQKTLPPSSGVPSGAIGGVIPPPEAVNFLHQVLIILPQRGAQDRSGLREIYCSDKAISSPA